MKYVELFLYTQWTITTQLAPKHVYLLKQTIENDHVQLILIEPTILEWKDNDKTDVIAFKRFLNNKNPIIICIQVFKQTIILQQSKHFVEFLNKSHNFSKENALKYRFRNYQN